MTEQLEQGDIIDVAAQDGVTTFRATVVSTRGDIITVRYPNGMKQQVLQMHVRLVSNG